jgi:hypothetical protein
VPGFPDVLLAQRAEGAKQPTVALIGDKRIAELLKRLGQRLVVFVQTVPGCGSVTLVRGQHEAAQVDANFGEPTGDVFKHGDACELGFGDESATLLDSRQLNTGKDAEPQQPHQRNRQQSYQPLAILSFGVAWSGTRGPSLGIFLDC